MTIIATTLSLLSPHRTGGRDEENRVDSSPLRRARGYVRLRRFRVKHAETVDFPTPLRAGDVFDSEPVLHPVFNGVTLMVIKE